LNHKDVPKTNPLGLCAWRMVNPETPLEPRRRLYGRSRGPKLRARPASLLSDLLPVLAVPSGALPEPQRPLWLEVGIGKGEHLVAQAQANPDVDLIGCEPYQNGMAACLGLVEDTGVTNVRLHLGDALDVIERLPSASLERLFLLHPDPWPKARHAKRRFINPGPLDHIARVLKPGAEFRVGTDHPTYLQWTLFQMQRRPDFVWMAEEAKHWQVPPIDWPETRYEAWARSEGRPVWYLRYRRV
jgi:tRNA (guanine-N7-)-methyltransferase